MKKKHLRLLSLWLALCMAFSLFTGWGPRAAASARLLDGGIVFDNNACPWGSEMTKTSFTLNIRTTSDPSGNAYQWQCSPDGETAWANVAGATDAQFHVSAPIDGGWYRCVVTNGGASAASKAIEAVRASTEGDVHGRIWTNTESMMAGRWFLSNGKMAYTCNLHSPISVFQQFSMAFGEGGKFHVFGEYVNPADGKTYMLQTSYGSGGWQIYSSQDTAPAPIKFGMFFEDNYHLEECQFMFRDEYPYKVYIGPKMEEGYHSLCIWTDSQLGSKTLFGDYSDYAALQTIFRKDGSPLQISLVAAESLSVATEDTASMVVNTEDIDASTDFRFFVGNRRYVKAFEYNIIDSVTSGYTTGSVVSNGRTFDNVVTVVEGLDSGMSLSWLNQSDSEPIWFSIGAGSVHDAEIITNPEDVEPEPSTSPWKALQAAIDSAPSNGSVRRFQLVRPGESASGAYTAVYTDENGNVPAQSDDTFLRVAAGKNIVLDLNGNTIDRNLSVSTSGGNAMRVEGALTLEDSAGGGLIRGAYNYASGAEGGGVFVADGGAFTMNGGAISGNWGYYGGGVAVAEGGAFTMNGGEISGNRAAWGGGVSNSGTFALVSGGVRQNNALLGGGVFNNMDAETIMRGGGIVGNSADDGDGGGVANSGAFTMSGGSIAGNSAVNGGGVVIADGQFAVTGGAITDNEAEDYGGGVMLYDGEFAVSGAFDLYDNTAGGKQGNVYLSEDMLITVAGSLELSTPISVTTEDEPTGTAPVVLTDGLPGYAATADFASENPDYEVQLNSAGEAVLALPSPELLTPPAAKSLTYNGAAQTLIVAGTADNGTLVYKLGESGAYSAALPTATDAGRYTVYYKVAGENGVADTSEQSLAVTIAPKPITDAMVTAGTVSTVYSGGPQTNAVAVTDGGKTLTAGTDYELSGDTATNVGTYTATVAGTGNYTGTVEKTWDITPAGIRPSIALDGWTYGDAANTPVIGGNAGNGAVLIGYKPRSADDEAYSSAVPLSAGDYTVRVRIAATDNYTAGEAAANFTISKRPATVTAAAQSVLEGGAIDDSVTRAALSGAVSGHTLDDVTLTSTSTATPTTAGTITPGDARIVKSGTDVTENYDITYVGGTLTVEKVIRSYPVTFYADSAGETVSQQHDILSGETLSAYAGLTLENDARRTFAGWSLEANVTEYKGNEGKILDFNGFTMPEEAVSVYPVWVENQLNVRLDLGAYDAQNAQSWYDASQYDPATPAYMEAVRNRNFWEKAGALVSMTRINAATRPGYTLDGWYTQGGVPWDASWKLDPEYCDRNPDGTVILLEDTEYRNF
ncbi:MAG: hypothetical protein IJQ25_00180, partial [Oscillibacter sp.]|nr:hypothetical protein [Oscillibacter sp.]